MNVERQQTGLNSKRSLSGPHDRFNFVLFVKTYTDRTHEHIFIVELMKKKKKMNKTMRHKQYIIVLKMCDK